MIVNIEIPTENKVHKGTCQGKSSWQASQMRHHDSLKGIKFNPLP